MGLTPEEQEVWNALKAKAEVIEKPKTLADILHKVISFLGTGPVHDELHEAVDEIPEPSQGPPGPEGPPGPPGPPADTAKEEE